MSSEQFTESLIRDEMGIVLGENDFGWVLPQGDCSRYPCIHELLKDAGGKPKVCPLDTYDLGGHGRAKPEFIITFADQIDTIIVVECKKALSRHISTSLDHPNGYAVDGALYYAKYLKREYNVIALAVSGTGRDKFVSDAYYWPLNAESYMDITKARNVIYEPAQYLKLVKGEKVSRRYSLEEIRQTAIDMNNALREVKVTERQKPILVAGILIALSDPAFSKEYPVCTTVPSLISNLNAAIDRVLDGSDIKKEKIADIKNAFKSIGKSQKLKSIPLGQYNSITWYIEQLDNRIKPMMDNADQTLDSLGVFYHEFVKYSGGDGKGLGIVLTPQHLTEFMCDLADISMHDRVVDIACGSASFLVTAMSTMWKQAENSNDIEKIKSQGLYGVELDDDIYTLAIANMIVRKDGKSNIYNDDCFKSTMVKELKKKGLTVGLINPPYSQRDHCELEFVMQMLDILQPGSTGVAVVPVSCAIGTKYGDIRKELIKKHTLDAVFSLPDDIFYPTGTNVCVMVWKAHRPHNPSQETFFGYCKDDGFVKRKKLGRVDAYNMWPSIEHEWVSLYRNRDVKPGLSARKGVKDNEEWLCEAYMETDFSTLSRGDFQRSVSDFFAFQVKNYDVKLESKFEVCKKHLELQIESWKSYKLGGEGGLFAVMNGTRLTKEDMVPGDLNYLGAISDNNCVRDHIDAPALFPGNTITVNYNGSVGESFYQSDPYWPSDDVKTLIPQGWELNKYRGLFLCAVIRMEQYRYSYGRKWTKEKMENTFIKLPTSFDGAPDWLFMEDYIKTCRYSDVI